ncbi:MAG TPA: PHB depolymerase family esterase [Thermoanaerobaculia bacterium]|jgi:phospholipase/carboxylesterase|nr:PHB depolymerase family esterase [Thermoanaerobaculia bacterium]
MTVTRHEDLSLHYVLSVPSSKPDDAEMPLVIVMHGLGADANDLADLAPMLDGGYRFVFPNAPKPFEPMPGYSFGWSWFDGFPPEGDSIVQSRTKLLALIDELVKRYPTPEGKIAVTGFSQGGLMALDVGFRTKQKIAAIVVMSGAIYEADMPDLRAQRELPVLLIHGTQDDMVPVLTARRTRHILEEHGLAPEYHEFPMGHHVTPESIDVVADFLRRGFGNSKG